jgi:hypothetical protein
MKKVILLIVAMLPLAAFSSSGNVQFNGLVADSCTFNSAAPGTLTVSGLNIDSVESGSITVVNNSPQAFSLSFGNTDLVGAPNGEEITSVIVTGNVTGDNSGHIMGDTLANAGVDVLSVDLSSGVLDRVASAGVYIITTIVNCDAVVPPGAAPPGAA